MDEQEKKYQDLFTELTNYERSGVRMQMNGFPASPLQIVSAHMVREESNYMRDYILDEQGMIRELDFKKSRPYGVTPRNAGQYFLQEDRKSVV